MRRPFSLKGMNMRLRVIAAKGTPGNPRSKPRDLINPDDKGCVMDAGHSINVFYAGKCVSIGFDGTVSVSDELSAYPNLSLSQLVHAWMTTDATKMPPNLRNALAWAVRRAEEWRGSLVGNPDPAPLAAFDAQTKRARNALRLIRK